MCLATMDFIMQHAQYDLLFLVLVVNSDRFWILPSYTLLLMQATCSYALLLRVVIELNVITQPDWYGTHQIFSAASESSTGARRGERGDPEEVRFHPQPVLI